MENINLLELLRKSDLLSKKIEQNKDNEQLRLKRLKLNRKVWNLVEDLHWKTAQFLVSNYDIIFLPIFGISQMVKGKKLHRSVKRVLQQYRFYSFQQKLEWLSRRYGKRLFIVDESWTSRTCCFCGTINPKSSKEELQCNECLVKQDRDIRGAICILIRTLR